MSLDSEKISSVLRILKQYVDHIRLYQANMDYIPVQGGSPLSREEYMMIKENITIDNLRELHLCLHIVNNYGLRTGRVWSYDLYFNDAVTPYGAYFGMIELFREVFSFLLTTEELERRFLFDVILTDKIDIIGKLICPPLLKMKDQLRDLFRSDQSSRKSLQTPTTSPKNDQDPVNL